MGNLKLFELQNIDERLKEKVDIFIESDLTTGEFINSIRYLSYHESGRFKDASVVVIDIGSMSVKGVMMAALSEDGRGVLSHPGTTFAGPVIEIREKLNVTFQILEMIFEYYENKYEYIEVKCIPAIYTKQPVGRLEYFLQKRGYCCHMTGLANVIDISNLKSSEDILNLCKAKRRNQIRKAIKDEVFQVQKGEVIREDVWNNLNDNLKTKFSVNSTHSYEEILELQKRFPLEIVPYYALSAKDEYGAFALIYKFKNVYHTQYLDVNYGFSKWYPNLFLLFKLIENAICEGYEWFSFGVSTENRGDVLNEGLFEYKSEFGGGEVLITRYEWKKEINHA